MCQRPTQRVGTVLVSPCSLRVDSVVLAAQGVYVTPEMWAGIKDRLDTKLEDTHEVVHEHNKARPHQQRESQLLWGHCFEGDSLTPRVRLSHTSPARLRLTPQVVAALRAELEAERQKNGEAERAAQRGVQQVRQELEDERARALFLQQDLQMAREELERTKAAASAAATLAAQRTGTALRGAPNSGASGRQATRADELSRALDGTGVGMSQMEARRGALHAARIEELEAELAQLKMRHAGDQARCDAALAAAQAAQEACAVLEGENASLRVQLEDAVGPQHEVNRLRLDNGRLIALLESTREYKDLLADLSLGGRHYVELAEVLSEQEVFTEHVRTIRDRGFDPRGLELQAWVPRQCISLAQAFIGRMQPRGLPVAPFMQLLIELNAAWRQHTAARSEQLRKRHAAEVAGLKRQLNQRQPYRQVLAESELTHLRKLLKTSTGALFSGSRPLERMREAADKSDSEEARLLLEWGMHTIESLAQQLTHVTDQNMHLRRRMLGGDVLDAETAAAESAGGSYGYSRSAYATPAGTGMRRGEHDTYDGEA